MINQLISIKSNTDRMEISNLFQRCSFNLCSFCLKTKPIWKGPLSFSRKIHMIILSDKQWAQFEIKMLSEMSSQKSAFLLLNLFFLTIACRLDFFVKTSIFTVEATVFFRSSCVNKPICMYV